MTEIDEKRLDRSEKEWYHISRLLSGYRDAGKVCNDCTGDAWNPPKISRRRGENMRMQKLVERQAFFHIREGAQCS